MTSNHPDHTRASIFLRLRDGDASRIELTWREFVERYAPIIAGFARRRGLAPADADDCVQEVLLGFFRVSPDFEYDPARGRFRSYLKTATVRVIAKRISRDRAAGVPTDDLDTPDTHAEHDWDWAWEQGVLRRAMDDTRRQFEPATFEAFELTAVRNVPTAEAADRLSMTEPAVRQAKSRVTRAVRERIESIRAEEG